MALQASILPCLLHYVRNLAILRIKDKLLTLCSYCMAIKNTIVIQQVIQTFREYKELEKSLLKGMHYTITIFFLSIPPFLCWKS